MPQTYNVGSRSRFVSAVAWLFIVLAALACEWAVIQNATQSAWAASMSTESGLTGLLGRYLPWAFSCAIALSLATLVCAIGLLRRFEWARRVFIGLLLVAIGVDLASLWLQQELIHRMVDTTLRQMSLSMQAAEVFGNMAAAARLLAGVLTLAAGLVLAGIIRLLMSPSVRQEFA